ncbi:Type 1 glutamine amidotransferase-like domain-containing protein [Paenibacillus sp. FSL K6-1096]|uniref:Type 1 glutamine amidotransferase-like domain-containing protein n=1 Tax=Paenibacillus sp. FSL K6-1096 TaxID=2921460 RepID=UPI0030EE2882
MGIIVAIGGGEISELETLSIDQTIVDLTNKRKPKALFIPTASQYGCRRVL